jgi:hypothetical protein
MENYAPISTESVNNLEILWISRTASKGSCGSITEESMEERTVTALLSAVAERRGASLPRPESALQAR